MNDLSGFMYNAIYEIIGLYIVYLLSIEGELGEIADYEKWAEYCRKCIHSTLISPTNPKVTESRIYLLFSNLRVWMLRPLYIKI